MPFDRATTIYQYPQTPMNVSIYNIYMVYTYVGSYTTAVFYI